MFGNSNFYKLNYKLIPVEHWKAILKNDDENEKLILFYKKIGENIKKIRIKKGFSQLKLANAMGYDSVGHIAKAEIYKYEKKFNLEHLFKKCTILNVPITEIFEGTNDFFIQNI